MSEFGFQGWKGPLRDLRRDLDEVTEREVVWRGARRRLVLSPAGFWFTRGYNYTVAHDADAPEIGNWLLVERRPKGLRLWRLDQEPALQDVEWAIESGEAQLARFSYFVRGQHSDQITRIACTLADGESAWLTVGDRFHHNPPFHMAMDEDEFFGDGQAHLRRLEAECAQPDSDARFALDWKFKSHYERLQSVFGAQSLEELKDLMRDALRMEPRLWEIAQRLMWTLVDAHGYSRFSTAGDEFMQKLNKSAPHLEPLARFLVEFWPLAVTKEELASHRCLRQFIEENEFWPAVDVAVYSPMTFHEHLEARLRLRDWFEQNAPDRMDVLLAS